MWNQLSDINLEKQLSSIPVPNRREKHACFTVKKLRFKRQTCLQEKSSLDIQNARENILIYSKNLSKSFKYFYRQSLRIIFKKA